MSTVHIKVRRDKNGKLKLASDVKEFLIARNSGASIIAQEEESGEVMTFEPKGNQYKNAHGEVIDHPVLG